MQNDTRLRKRVTAWVEWVENNLLDDDFKLKLELSNRLDKITDVLESMKADWDNAMHNAKEQDRDYLRWGMLKPLIQKGDKDTYMAEGSFGETLRRMMVLLKPSEDIFVGSTLEKDMPVDFASPQELKDILLQIQFYVNAVDNSGKAFNPVYLTQINSEINELLSILDKQIKNNSMRDTETKKTNKFLSGREKIKKQFVQKNGITIEQSKGIE